MNKTKLQDIAQGIDVTEFVDYRDYLYRIFSEAKTEDRGLTYHAFSELLGLSRSNVVWLVMTGRRALTPTTTGKIVEALALTRLQRQYFETLVDFGKARLPKQREELFQRLSDLKARSLGDKDLAANFEYFSEWYHPVIREMTQLPGFHSDPAWIARKLHNRLLPKQAKESLELLERLGLVEFCNERGRHIAKGGQITPEREVSTLAAVSFHQKMIEMARESLTQVPEDRREINTITLCLTKGKVKTLRQEILRLCQRALEIEESDEERADVYQFNVQLFPFTKDSE